MDTNLVLPLGVDKCAVVFDYYFADTSKKALTKNRASIKVSEKVQEEDEAIATRCSAGWLRARNVAGRAVSATRSGRASVSTDCSTPTLLAR